MPMQVNKDLIFFLIVHKYSNEKVIYFIDQGKENQQINIIQAIKQL